MSLAGWLQSSCNVSADVKHIAFRGSQPSFKKRVFFLNRKFITSAEKRSPPSLLKYALGVCSSSILVSVTSAFLQNERAVSDQKLSTQALTGYDETAS